MGELEELRVNFPNIKHQFISESDLLCGDWYVVETSLLSSLDDVGKIIFDINNSYGVSVESDGTLAHNKKCEELDHKLDDNLSSAIDRIEPQSFKFAVYYKENTSFSNSPIVVPIKPMINYLVFPDHPHISKGGISNKILIPDSLCYGQLSTPLNASNVEILTAAIQQAIIWFFRHQIWIATRKNNSAVWIGPQSQMSPEVQLDFLRNPNGGCRCGCGKKYFECHLNEDIQNYQNPQFIQYSPNDGKCGDLEPVARSLRATRALSQNHLTRDYRANNIFLL